jgi:hypothetical protein
MASPEPRFQEWESVYTTDNEPTAYIIAGRLQNEGIEARVHKEALGSAYGINVGLLGKVDVLVRSEDFDRASAILEDEDLEAENDEDYEEDEEDE